MKTLIIWDDFAKDDINNECGDYTDHLCDHLDKSDIGLYKHHIILEVY